MLHHPKHCHKRPPATSLILPGLSARGNELRTWLRRAISNSRMHLQGEDAQESGRTYFVVDGVRKAEGVQADGPWMRLCAVAVVQVVQREGEAGEHVEGSHAQVN